MKNSDTAQPRLIAAVAHGKIPGVSWIFAFNQALLSHVHSFLLEVHLQETSQHVDPLKDARNTQMLLTRYSQ